MSIFAELASEFQFLDYSATHNQLVIRSMKNSKNRNYNIDIIFKGVLSLLMQTNFKGIEISLFESEHNNFLVNDYGFKNTKNYKIFSIKDNSGKEYFINAMCFGVYQNKLDILETSIGRYDMGNLGENILWYAG